MSRSRKSRMGARKAQVPVRKAVLPPWIRASKGRVTLQPKAARAVARLEADELGLLVRLAVVLAHRPGVETAEAVRVAAHESKAAARRLRRLLG